jgi:DNA-binding winged helix-turn-helix (wHTH) protein
MINHKKMRMTHNLNHYLLQNIKSWRKAMRIIATKKKSKVKFIRNLNRKGIKMYTHIELKKKRKKSKKLKATC